MGRIGEHAVVIGASMGGLLAARALSDFFDQVTVLERDSFPAEDVPRKGVPQGRHAHGLLARGRSVIEDFFPGWTDEVVASGGIRGDIAHDVNWIGHGVTIKTAPSDMIGLLASRPVLEGHVRRRLLALKNVRAIEGCAVQGLVAGERGRCDIRRPRQDRQWRRAGCPARISWSMPPGAARRARPGSRTSATRGPRKSRIEIGIGYTTRVYRRKPTDLGGKLAMVVAGSGRTGATARSCSRPRTAGSSRSAAISAITRPTTTRCSRPMPARCRHRRSTTSWRMRSR